MIIQFFMAKKKYTFIDLFAGCGNKSDGVRIIIEK